MQQKIFQILFEEDEITWQSIIYRLIKEENMDPWDVDVSLLTKKYIQMLRNLKEMDFRISGKVLLAAAILLKIKSNRLMGEDLNELDNLIASAEAIDDEFGDDFYEQLEREFDQVYAGRDAKVPKLIPKTPQPRSRKVSIYDLIEALNGALVVNKRRVLRTIPARKIVIPEKTKDITEVIREVYDKIVGMISKGTQKLFFNQLVPSGSKEDIVLTFVPLLHLTNERKIYLNQKKHFGPIEVVLRE